MPIHTEWDTADDCEIAVLTAGQAEEAFGPDEPGRGHVLVLGGAGGGCLAITGTHSQLLALAGRIHTAVRAAVPAR